MARRYFMLSLLLTALLTSQPVMAQEDQFKVSFGVQGGLDLTEMNFTGGMLNPNNRAGFFVGPSLKFKMPIVGLGLDLSVLYDQRNLGVAGENIHQRSILLPLNMRCGVDFFGAFRVFLSAGPQVTFNIGDDTFTWNETESYKNTFQMRKSTFSVNLGGGVCVGPIEAAIYYNINCGRTGDVTWDYVKSQLEQQTLRSAKAETNAWRIAVGYYF